MVVRLVNLSIEPSCRVDCLASIVLTIVKEIFHSWMQLYLHCFEHLNCIVLLSLSMKRTDHFDSSHRHGYTSLCLPIDLREA